MPVISPLPAKGAAFKLGATAYQFSQWDFTIELDTGRLFHFSAQTDTPGNYWPTIFTNFAVGYGSTRGPIDHGVNAVPVSWASSLYPGSSGTISVLWSTTDGFTAPAVFKKFGGSTDAAASGAGAAGGLSFEFELTGPPTRVFS